MSQAIAPLLADLHLLTVLAQTHSFTLAARRLGVSKASVSMRLTERERAGGLPLVRRTTRSVALTEAGMQLVEDTHASFARIEQGFANVKDLAGNPRGVVRVTAPVALGRQLVAPTLPDFLRAYPEIQLELDLSDRFVNLAQEGFDLAIRHTSTPPETHVAWVLAETPSRLVASPVYLARAGTPQRPADLAAHACLMYLRTTGAPTWSFERRTRSGTTRAAPERVNVLVGGPFKANNSEALREAVLGSLGIGLLPEFSARAAPSGGLVTVLADWKPVGFFGERVYAVRPWAAQVPRAVQCLVDHLRTALAATQGDETTPPRHRSAAPPSV